MKDSNNLIKIEQAIEEKYGEDTIQDPKSSWTPQKEKQYLEQIKKLAKSEKLREKVEVEGVLMPKKLFRKESIRTCPQCKIYSFKMKDDLYMAKYKCCFICYLKHVEGKEKQWLENLQKKSS